MSVLRIQRNSSSEAVQWKQKSEAMNSLKTEAYMIVSTEIIREVFLLKFFEYLFQGEIIYLRGRLLISGGDIFICLCYSCVICLLPSALSDRKFISFIYVFVIIKKGEIVRTRFVLINYLSFDDNNNMNFA